MPSVPTHVSALPDGNQRVGLWKLGGDGQSGEWVVVEGCRTVQGPASGRAGR